jgi:plasmid maintenance system antidote protein VapI
MVRSRLQKTPDVSILKRKLLKPFFMAQDQKNLLNNIGSFEDLFAQAERHPEYWVERAILEFTDEVLRKLKASGISRTELAAELGHSRPQISRLLSGRNNFTLRTMVEVSRALNCELRLHLQSAGMQTAWIEYGMQRRRIKMVAPVSQPPDVGQTFTPCPKLLKHAHQATLRVEAVGTYEALPSAA